MVRSSLEEPPSVVSTSEKNTPPPTHREKAKTSASARRGIHSKDEGLGLREERLEQMRFIRKTSARRRPCDGYKESHGHSLGKVESGRGVFTAETRRDFPGGAEAETPCSQCRGSGSDPCWETRSHLLQLGVCMLQLKIPHALTKDQRFRVLQLRPCTAK